ncbi:hypothetical protein ACLKA6_018682 [Drosophila palustris]
MSSPKIKRNGAKRAPARLPFHPRRSNRKPPPLELAGEPFVTLPFTDVLELATSPILEHAVDAGLTPPPTSSPESAGLVFHWPVAEKEEEEEQPQVQSRAQQPAQPATQLLEQPLAQSPTPQPPVQPRVQPPVKPAAQPPTQSTAQPPKKRPAKLPVRPLTPTIIEVLDSDEEEPKQRVRFDPVIRRQVPMTPGPPLEGDGGNRLAK